VESYTFWESIISQFILKINSFVLQNHLEIVKSALSLVEMKLNSMKKPPSPNGKGGLIHLINSVSTKTPLYICNWPIKTIKVEANKMLNLGVYKSK